MRIAKPILLISTPVGIVGGLFEGYRLAGGLVLIMAAMLTLIGTAAATVVATVRRDEAEQRARRLAARSLPASHPSPQPVPSSPVQELP